MHEASRVGVRTERERAARRHECTRAEERRPVSDADEAHRPLIARALVEVDAHFFSVARVELGICVGPVTVIVAAIDDEGEVGDHGDATLLRTLDLDAKEIVRLRRRVEHSEEREIAGCLHAEQILAKLLQRQIATLHLASTGDTQLVERPERDDGRIGIDEAARRVEYAQIRAGCRETHERVCAIREVHRPGRPQGTLGARGQRIEKQRVADEPHIGKGILDKHSRRRGGHSQRTIAQRSVTAVKRFLPTASHMRVSEQLPSQLVERAWPDGQCLDLKAVEYNIGDDRSGYAA